MGNSLDLLSSKSENRFLVNFQITKATIPITAIPPATDIPMIDPVPRPVLSLFGEDVVDGVEEELELVTVTVTGTPFGFMEVEIPMGGVSEGGAGVEA